MCDSRIRQPRDVIFEDGRTLEQAIVEHGEWLRVGGKGLKLVLQGVDLRDVNFMDRNLYGADFSDADLDRAVFLNAIIQGANFWGANLNWRSRNIIAEILRQDANVDLEKLKIAGLVLFASHICWEELFSLDNSLNEWALGVLRPYEKEGNKMPVIGDGNGGEGTGMSIDTHNSTDKMAGVLEQFSEDLDNIARDLWQTEASGNVITGVTPYSFHQTEEKHMWRLHHADSSTVISAKKYAKILSGNDGSVVGSRVVFSPNNKLSIANDEHEK